MGESELNGLMELSKILNFSKFMAVCMAIFALWLLVKGLNKIADRISLQFPNRRLLLLQIVTILAFLIYIGGGILVVYGILKPPKELMIALGGSAAVAIGLSLKDLVASLVAGFILLFDRPFQVGDRVAFGDTYGEIKSIGLRAVRLVTLDDNLVTIPNSRFMTDSVASGNSGALDMMITVDFYTSLDCDISKVKRLIYDTAVTSRFVYLKKKVSVVISEKFINDYLALEFKVKAYVIDVKYEKAFQTDIVTQVETAFKEESVIRPYKAIRSL
ncbi:MAG: mechanosensitive ion channel protein [Bdellovibrionaceae bacterium]|nr:mechanosensitive ion channel protein [Pseudobdellovibrionaceae bacterium]MEC9283400.1 mechanosensitive ion channel domain-containing protein [Bdellovibrionota bacterium]|tara:strand:- start:106882 stop:107700 length:819 start_codon:yes stop_codon:yes gene_type:complete